MDLLGVARELYQLIPAEFTAARNTRAKDAAAAGNAPLAAEIRRLAKPSATAWALNRLATDTPKTAEEFARLGGSLRQAQEHADREQLVQLVSQRKTLIRSTSKAVQQLAAHSGVRLSSSASSEVEESLLAALADEVGHAAVFSGRLVRAIESDGLDPVDLEDAVAGPALPRSGSAGRPTRSSSGDSASAGSPSAAARTSAAAKARQALIERTRGEMKTAEAAVQAARKRQASLETDREALEADVRELQEQFDLLEKRRTELDNRASRIRREITKTDDAHRKATAAAERAANKH